MSGNCQPHISKITSVFIDQMETAIMTTDSNTVNIYNIKTGFCF